MEAENFNNHKIHVTLDSFNSFLSNKVNGQKLGYNNLQMLQEAFSFIKGRLNITLPMFLLDEELDRLESELMQGLAHLESFISNNQPNYISYGMDNFRTAARSVKNFPIQLVTGDYDLPKLIAQYQKAIKVSEQTKDEIIDEYKQQISNLNKSISSKQKKIDELESQFSVLKSDYEQYFQDNTNKFKNQIEDYEKNTKSIEERIFNSNKTFREELKQQIDSFIKTEKEKFSNLYNEQKEESSQVLVMLNDKLTESKKIVNIIGNVGVTGNYQKIAKDHKDTADLFRWISLGFLILMIVPSVFLFWESTKNGFDLYNSIFRMLLVSLLLYPAIYTSKESSKHRKLEIENKKLELELASFRPFIDGLEKSKQDEVIEDRVKEYFGNNKIDINTQNVEGFETITTSITKALIEFAKVIKK